MTLVNVPGHCIAGCGACGGMWLDNAASAIVARASLHPELWNIVSDLDKLDTSGLTDVAVADKSYREAAMSGGRHCPLCSHALRQTFPVGDIEVDVCDVHGTFLDQHELRAIHNSVALEQARRQALNESKRLSVPHRSLFATILETIFGEDWRRWE